MNYNNVGEMIAQIVENDDTPIEIANRLWRHVQETFEAADITHPDTIRQLYPVAAQIVADNESWLKQRRAKQFTKRER